MQDIIRIFDQGNQGELSSAYGSIKKRDLDNIVKFAGNQPGYIKIYGMNDIIFKFLSFEEQIS